MEARLACSHKNLIEHFATEDKPFHFTDSGLDNVYLVGIKYFTCECGNISAEIPALKRLMQLIACDIVKSQSNLEGAEIKFLRKRLGKKATEYCKFLAIEPETLSRIENGKMPASGATDKLARLTYAILSEDPNLSEIAINILNALALSVMPEKGKIVLQMSKNHEWSELQKAA